MNIMDSDKHVSVPRVFSSGNFKEWLTRFNICAKSNGWDDTKKNAKIGTFLEGEALAVYLEMDKSKGEFKDVVAELENNFHPPSEEFNVISTFNGRKMLPNETPRLFLHELKKLLKSSGIPETAHDRLLLHQFICGLPVNISAHIKLLPGVKTPEDALRATQKLYAVGASTEPCNAAAIETGDQQPSAQLPTNEFEELKMAVQSLTQKVEELLTERRPEPEVAALRRDRQPIVCYRCRRPGHPARLCRAPAPVSSQHSGNGRGRGAAVTQHFGHKHQGSANFS